ncbi:MAG TPA: hypothetical protein VLF90_00955 [Patescibacteria group bacterium]|nr:hypothetical protein [Patescibacteria group bacterium]
MHSSLLTDSTTVQKNELRAATNSPKNINEDDSLVELGEVLEEVQKLLEVAAIPLPRKVGLADTAALLEKLRATPKIDDNDGVMYVFDKNGNKVLL